MEHRSETYDQINMDELLTGYDVAHVPSEEGWYVAYRLSSKTLVVRVAMANILQVPYSSASSTLGTTKRIPTITSFSAIVTTKKASVAEIKGHVNSMRVYIEQKRL
jgi:hypothetical protein